MKSLSSRVGLIKQTHRKALLGGAALTALLLVNPALADDNIVDTSTTVQNGGAVLDGNDTLEIVSGGSIVEYTNTKKPISPVYAYNDMNTVTLSGSASVQTEISSGISMQGEDNKLFVTDSASVTASTALAIDLDGGERARLEVSGSARISGSSDIIFMASDRGTILLSGAASVIGTEANTLSKDAINYFGSFGELVVSDTAEVTVSGESSSAIYVDGDNIEVRVLDAARLSASGQGAETLTFVDTEYGKAVISGLARVIASGENSVAVSFDYTPDSTVEILGSAVVSATGQESTGLFLNGTDIRATISGTVSATNGLGGVTSAIEVSESRTDVQLDEGATIIGIIENDDEEEVGLVMNVGQQTSYVLHLFGSGEGTDYYEWDLTDLDGRTPVNTQVIPSEMQVSAVSASHAETANEMLFERVSQLTQSALANTSGANTTPWADAYIGSSERDRGGANASLVDYDTDTVGLSLGLPISSTGKHNVELVFNYHDMEVDISNASHVLDAESLSFGLVVSERDRSGPWSLKGYAFLGQTEYEGARQVMNNLDLTGWETVTADFTSDHILAGVEAKNLVAMSNGMTFEGVLHANIAREEISGYNESSYFSWADRSLTQSSAGATAGVLSQYKGLQVFGRVGLTFSDLMSGDKAAYKNMGASSTYSDVATHGAYVTGAVGVDYVSPAGVTFKTSMSGFSSDDDQTGLVANLALEYKF